MSSASQQARRRVLVVEDDAVMRNTLVAALNDAGFESSGCASTTEARDLLAETPRDLVVLDLSLGAEFAEPLLAELARRPKSPSVIVCSGFPLANLVAARHGARCIKKPFELDAFVTEVQRAADAL